eukprot:9193066-Heterocapsa_arctica.AAC.1
MSKRKGGDPLSSSQRRCGGGLHDEDVRCQRNGGRRASEVAQRCHNQVASTKGDNLEVVDNDGA